MISNYPLLSTISYIEIVPIVLSVLAQHTNVSKRIITKTHFYSCHVKIVFWSSSFSKLMFISGCVKFCYYFICLFSRLSFMITFCVKMKSHLSYCGTNEDIWDTCSRSCDCFMKLCLIYFWCKIKTWKNKHEGNLIPHSRLFKG